MKLTTFKQKMNILKLVLVFVGAFTIYSFTSAPSVTTDPITTTDVKSVEGHSGKALVTFAPGVSHRILSNLFSTIQTQYGYFTIIVEPCISEPNTYIIRYGRGSLSRSLPTTLLDPNDDDGMGGPAGPNLESYRDILLYEGRNIVMRYKEDGVCNNDDFGGEVPKKIFLR